MSSHKDKHKKAWYKRWWGIILAIIFWPYFLIWFLWAKSKRKLPTKIILTVILAGIIYFSSMVFLYATGTIGQSSSSSSIQKLTPAQVTSQVTDTLTTATNNTAQLMLDGKNAATQQNPLGTGNNDGPFSKWEKTLQSTTDSNTDDAYNSAGWTYDGNSNPPAILDTWKADNDAAFKDIGVWQVAEGTYLNTLSAGGGSTLASEKTSADADYTQFQTDLAKAEADIAKLSGQPFKATVQTSGAPQAATPQPTASVSSLNASAVSGFTTELNDLSSQMAEGQSLSQQADASAIGGAFNNWSQSEQHDQNVKNNNNVTAAFNKATNAFYDAHQQSPAALDNWNSDAGNVVSDITQWADAEEAVMGDQVSGTDPSSDQQTVDSDYQKYQSDMAKAQADIKQL